MSLLDDLQSLDLSKVTGARAAITLTVNGADLQAVLSGGVAQAALGDLGTALAELRDTYKDPEALLAPLLGGLAELAGSIRPEDLPVAEVIAGVRHGAELLAELLAAVGGDADAVRKLVGIAGQDVLGAAVGTVEDVARTLTDEVGTVAQLLRLAEQGLPHDPQALAAVALRLLLPNGSGPLATLRGHLDAIFATAGTIGIPVERVGGLVGALDAVSSAAASGDVELLRRAVGDLARVRASVVGTLTDELATLAGRIDALHLDAVLEPLLAAGRAVQTVEGGVLDLVARLREVIAQAREVVKLLDPAVVVDAVPQIFDVLEEFARREIAAPIDALVERVKQWLRDLLGQLGLRALRQRLRDAFHAAAEAIADADLGRYGDEVVAKLEPIRHALDSVDLASTVRGAVQDAAGKVRGALDGIDGAIQEIKSAIEAVAGEAEAILQRGADALASFKTEIDRIAGAVDQLGIEEAARAVTQALSDLRAKAEELLAKAPLPEPLRPLVEQLVKQVESIDLDHAILGPVHDALDRFKLGATIEEPIKAGIGKLRDALDHLVPAELVAAIEAEIGAALDKLRAFDPARLVGELGTFVNEAADALAALDPAALTAAIREPFEALLGLLDTLAPEKLLAPAFQVWDAAIGAVALPTPDAAVGKVAGLIGGAGDRMRKAALGPVTQLVPGSEVTERDPDAGPPPPLGHAPTDVVIGDVVRVLGFLPAKLHEALGALDDGAAGAVMKALDAVTGGLGADLQRVEDVLWGLEQGVRGALDDTLAPLGAAEARADVALQTHFAAGGVDVTFAFDAVYDASPARIREALLAPLETTVAHARDGAERVMLGAGAELDRVADRLARSALAQTTSSLGALRAALDVEPLAADFEALVGEALRTGLDFLPGIADALATALARLQALVSEFNPGTQLLKFLSVLDVLRAELDVLNPRRLAAELGEIHAVIVRAVSAYDPGRIAAVLSDALADVVGKLRALAPDQLLGDLHFLDDLKAKIDGVVPADALAGIGAGLKDVGDRLAALDPAALLAAVDAIPKRIEDAFAEVVRQIKQEIVALLESIKYIGGSVSVEAEVGT